MVIGWRWLEQAVHAQRGPDTGKEVDADFYRGKLQAVSFFPPEAVPATTRWMFWKIAKLPPVQKMQNSWFLIGHCGQLKMT
jgi:butyryl-CoA dehydrogenase